MMDGGEGLYSAVAMILAFGVGFVAGLQYRQMKILSLVVLIIFVAILFEVVSISLFIH